MTRVTCVKSEPSTKLVEAKRELHLISSVSENDLASKLLCCLDMMKDFISYVQYGRRES